MSSSAWLLIFLELTTVFGHAHLVEAVSSLGRYLKIWPLVHQEVCYGTLGCFNNDYPFSSPWRLVDLLPESAEAIGTTFLLYTRVTPNSTLAEELRTGEEDRLKSSEFRGSKCIKLIVHGFTHDGQQPWVRSLVQELLKKDDCGVIVVDWSQGAQWPYMQAVANARLVGAQIAEFVRFLVEVGSASMDRIHVIGHSLGAHVAGYAGERLSSLGRITGLDPAAVFFETGSGALRLDRSDAAFVDVVHTDSGPVGFGLADRLGHVDFYPNGGTKQPGCVDKFTGIADHLLDGSITTFNETKVIDDFVCSHKRALDYYIQSVNDPCLWLSAHCASWTDFSLGSCRRCERAEDCMPLGYHATKPSTSPRSYYSTTSSAPPFCRHIYRIQLKISSLQKNPTRGRIYVTVTGRNATLPEEITYFLPLYKGAQTMRAEETIDRVFDSALTTGEILTVSIRYVTEVIYIQKWFYEEWVSVDSVTITTLDQSGTELRFPFCGGVFNSTVTYALRPKDVSC